MLVVQSYLKSGKTLEQLEEEFDIKATHHPKFSIFNLNYGLETPKLDKIGMECRSLCLDKDYNLVKRCFPRFFNLHEATEINDNFNWGDFSCNEKLDGSLVSLFYYNNTWIVSTRSGFGDNQVNDSNITYEDLFYRAFDRSRLSLLDKKVCYVFELTSPYCKIVRQYTSTEVYLLTCYRGEEELSDSYCDNAARIIDCPRPQKFLFKSAQEVYDFIRHKEQNDKTYEGVVLRDSNNLRIKVKSSTYVALHRLRGEGNNIVSPKYIIPLILSGEDSEVLNYWQEFQEHFDKVRDRLELHEKRICDLWDRVHHIEDQKEFALRILNETPFTGFLFTARKLGKHPKEIFRESPDMIYKVLYK